MMRTYEAIEPVVRSTVTSVASVRAKGLAPMRDARRIQESACQRAA